MCCLEIWSACRVHVTADFWYNNDGAAFDFDQSARVLGVVMDCRLRFPEYVRETVPKAA